MLQIEKYIPTKYHSNYALALRAVKTLVILFVEIYFFTLCYTNYRADTYYEKSQQALNELDLPNALKYADAALELNPLEPNYYRMRARVYITYLPYKPVDVGRLVKLLVLEDLEKAYNLNPQNLVTIRNLVPLYYFVATKDVSVPAGEKNIDADFVTYAKNFYAANKNHSPNDVGVYALIAKYEKRLSLTKEYDESVERVRVLRPDLLDWYESFR